MDEEKVKMTGGALAAQAMKNDGITHLFCVVGGHVFAILEGCEDVGIKIIDVRHEQAAAHMAEGWIANSFAGATPLLAIGGGAYLEAVDTNELQDFNQIDIVKPMTKLARTIYETHRVHEYVGMALRHATSGRPGPTYLETPMDLLFNEVDTAKVQVPEKHRKALAPAGNPQDIEAALKLIKKAKKPVIVAGSGVWWSQAHQELKQFIEKADIPLFTRNAGRGSVPDDHPLVLGGGFAMDPFFAATLGESDLLIIIGARFGYTFNVDAVPPDLKMIIVDIEASEICHRRVPEVGIVGDAKLVLRQFAEAISDLSHNEWVEKLLGGANAKRAMVEPGLTSDQKPIHPLRLFGEVQKFIDKDTIVCVDGGDVALWGNLILPAPGPGQYLSIASSVFGCLGVGIPYAIAAKLAHPEKNVILTTGDGTIGMTMMEFETAVRHNIPFVTIVGNDSCWGMIHRDFIVRRGRTIACELEPRRYDKIVEAMGGHGEYVEDPADIAPAIQRAIDSGKPACVNIMIDPKIGVGISET